MSLKSKFKTDAQAANEGVWVDYADSPNKDGSIPGFRIARLSQQNTKYTAAMRKTTKGMQITADGTVILEETDDNEADKVMLEAFVDTLLTDWRNFQPEDDGNNIPYSRDMAKLIFGNPDWLDLYVDLMAKTKKMAIFQTKAQVAEAKNS